MCKLDVDTTHILFADLLSDGDPGINYSYHIIINGIHLMKPTLHAIKKMQPRRKTQSKMHRRVWSGADAAYAEVLMQMSHQHPIRLVPIPFVEYLP